MIPVSVADLAGLLAAEVAGGPGTVSAAAMAKLVTGLTADSRQVEPGTLFLALPGERVDGHDFVVGAFAQGAVAALTSRAVAGAPGPCLVVSDPLIAAGRVARDQIDRAQTGAGRAGDATAGGLQVAGITGSSGKTSTKDLLAHVLRQTGSTVAPIGNLNNELGVPLTVCRIDAETSYLVVEMGARGIGHIAYLCQIAPPQVAAVLNVGTAHVSEFGGREQIGRAKGELIEALSRTGTAVLNADDPIVWAMRERTAARVLATSVQAEPAVPDAIWARQITPDASGCCSFQLQHKTAGVVGPKLGVQLQLTGRHHVANAVAAAGLAQALGLELPAIAAALGTALPESKWRMELTKRADGVLVINDAYNANPESMRAALDTVGELLASRRAAGSVGWAVLGDMLELGSAAAAEHRDLGTYAVGQGITRLVAIGEFAEQVVGGFRSAGRGEVQASVATDRDDAVRQVLAEIRPGDIVLVKASRGLALETVAAAIVAAGECLPTANRSQPAADHSEVNA